MGCAPKNSEDSRKGRCPLVGNGLFDNMQSANLSFIGNSWMVLCVSLDKLNEFIPC